MSGRKEKINWLPQLYIHIHGIFFSPLTRITSDNADTLTEIGILYLRINDTKNAYDKLFEVTTHHENCSRAYLALGAILQVYIYITP